MTRHSADQNSQLSPSTASIEDHQLEVRILARDIVRYNFDATIGEQQVESLHRRLFELVGVDAGYKFIQLAKIIKGGTKAEI